MSNSKKWEWPKNKSKRYKASVEKFARKVIDIEKEVIDEMLSDENVENGKENVNKNRKKED